MLHYKYLKHLIFLAFFITLVSCTDNETNVPKISKNTYSIDLAVNPLDSSGYYHNDALNYHFDRIWSNVDSLDILISRYIYEYSGEKYFKRNYYDSLTNNLRSYLYFKGFSQNVVDNVNFIDSMFTNLQLFTTVNGVEVVKHLRPEILNIVNYCIANNRISQTAYASITSIINNYYNGNDEVAAELSNSINLEDYNINDNPNIFIYKSIYNASLEFWGDTTGYPGLIKPTGNKHNNEILFWKAFFSSLVDAGWGALGGAAAGPAGAAVVGATGTALASDVLEDPGKYFNAKGQHRGGP